MNTNISVGDIKKLFLGKLKHHFGRDLKDCTRTQAFRSICLVLRDIMAQRLSEKTELKGEERELHYLSIEFLLGRSLSKNAFNLGLTEKIKQAVSELLASRKELGIPEDKLSGLSFEDFLETEPDAGLGNGGLGRLAACYLDSMTTLGLPATGYSICYEYGIFKQAIIDGAQFEMPDPWLEVGDVWLIPRIEETVTVRFGGHIEEYTDAGVTKYRHADSTDVLAIPKDMLISGYRTNHVNKLRLWAAQSPTEIDMTLFAGGKHIKAMEQNAMAQVITKVLYPDDNHFEGKLLRLRQQYFFVSATVQSIVREHKQKHGDLRNFHMRHVIHINDTHPTLVIPELMRILLDEEGMEWDEAWTIVRRSVAYTNHTVMSEALECWPQNIVEMLLPRVWRILCEINDRYITALREEGLGEYTISQMAIIWNGEVRMANLCAYACFAVNGVSALHSGILIRDIFALQYNREKFKFLNVTNGVDHRRWLAQINPELHALISDAIGDGYLTRPNELRKLASHVKDARLLEDLAAIKRRNKERLAHYVYREQGIVVDPDSIFDTQVKRLHEYKRQLLNVLRILRLYDEIRENPNANMTPRTFFFGAKAAGGYYMAKLIIRLIHSVAELINNDPMASRFMKVVFLQNYRVSVAELLIPASEISEQISIAGKEASGTGNMKFMLNGALTVGTLDGANVEISEFVGNEHIFIFGLTAQEADRLRREGYSSSAIYSVHEPLRRVLDRISAGFGDEVDYGDIVRSLLISDTYMLLADFESYCRIQKTAGEKYLSPRAWNTSSLANISAAGAFAADRSVAQYADHIWNLQVGR
ncbi:MAG: glycogen/starch/alpha-glucan phosphorylase [Oscillospiraceae bacterium]|jgi:starch phosphorylase|nr:glycogen/starch/alpha-glucan phosphorylase [Oscillospiraceae bacterium]